MHGAGALVFIFCVAGALGAALLTNATETESGDQGRKVAVPGLIPFDAKGEAIFSFVKNALNAGNAGIQEALGRIKKEVDRIKESVEKTGTVSKLLT